MDFKGKVALVTGGSRGIGRAIARGFAERGASVAVHYRADEAAATGTLKGLPGGPHGLFRCDVSDPDAARGLVEGVVSELGRLDILVNNAGIYELHRIDEIAYEQWLDHWRRTIGVNLLGPANVIYWAVLHMIDAGGGRIVNVTSRGAFRGEPTAPAYGAAKAGLNSLTQSLAWRLAPYKILVTAVAPGFVETDMTAEYLTGPKGDSIRRQSPLGRVATPDEIARVVLFLASEGTDYVTGAVVDVNGASYLRT